MRTNLLSVLCVLLLAGVCAGAFANEPGACPRKAEPFALRQVRLLDSPFKVAAERDREYLHELESDRLLHMFRKTASLPAPGEPMGGWEEKEVKSKIACLPPSCRNGDPSSSLRDR